MEKPYQVLREVNVLPAFVPVPTIGLLAVNAFLVKSREPYLVDTGTLADREAFVRELRTLLDPAELRWIYLTHTDPDHIGALADLLSMAPRAKVVTTFVAMAKLELGLRALPPDRVVLRNPGERLDLGDRTLTVSRPLTFDAPETTTVHDSRLNVLFSADMFGAPLDRPLASANEIPPERLEESQLLWASVDAPWVHDLDRQRFSLRCREIAEQDPAWILSSHLPPAEGMAERLCANLARAPEAKPFAAPDQPAFEAMLREAAGRPS